MKEERSDCKLTGELHKKRRGIPTSIFLAPRKIKDC